MVRGGAPIQQMHFGRTESPENASSDHKCRLVHFPYSIRLGFCCSWILGGRGTIALSGVSDPPGYAYEQVGYYNFWVTEGQIEMKKNKAEMRRPVKSEAGDDGKNVDNAFVYKLLYCDTYCNETARPTNTSTAHRTRPAQLVRPC